VTSRLNPEVEGVTVARILRPHGRRGEVAAEILTDFPARLVSLRAVTLCSAENSSKKSGSRHAAVRSCWLSKSRGGQAIFHFEGCDSISGAEKLVGLEIRIPLADRVKLPAGSYFVTDLIGCEVREKSGAAIGRVRDVQFTGEGIAGTPVLEIDSPQGEILIPLATEICVEIDTAARRIEVVLPEGLKELNLNS
jgi:16S rRNA processing protein RimM